MTAADPVVHAILRASLALLFAAAARHKAREPVRFAATLRDYRLLPAGWVPAAARLLIALEAAAAAALLVPPADPLGPALGLALLALYSGAIAWNLARGRRHIDCGCLGPLDRARRQPLSAWLLARNALLIAGAALLGQEPATRPLHPLDALSWAGSVALLALLWNAAHHLGSAGSVPLQRESAS